MMFLQTGYEDFLIQEQLHTCCLPLLQELLITYEFFFLRTANRTVLSDHSQCEIQEKSCIMNMSCTVKNAWGISQQKNVFNMYIFHQLHYYNQNIVVILTNICFTMLVHSMQFYLIRLHLLWKVMQKFNVIPASCLYLVASSLRPISRLSPCSSSRETLQLRGLTGRGAPSSSGAGNSSTNLPRKPLHSSSIMFKKWQFQHAQVQLVSIFHSDTQHVIAKK